MYHFEPFSTHLDYFDNSFPWFAFLSPYILITDWKGSKYLINKTKRKILTWVSNTGKERKKSFMEVLRTKEIVGVNGVESIKNAKKNPIWLWNKTMVKVARKCGDKGRKKRKK